VPKTALPASGLADWWWADGLVFSDDMIAGIPLKEPN